MFEYGLPQLHIYRTKSKMATSQIHYLELFDGDHLKFCFINKNFPRMRTHLMLLHGSDSWIINRENCLYYTYTLSKAIHCHITYICPPGPNLSQTGPKYSEISCGSHICFFLTNCRHWKFIWKRLACSLAWVHLSPDLFFILKTSVFFFIFDSDVYQWTRALQIMKWEPVNFYS